MSAMLRKKEIFTVITPIPSFVPRQLALDILHSHSEVITVNPLVVEHRAIPAPQNAATDEYYSTWYEITERLTFVPGIGKLGASIIKFNGCFHDMPWGLQTHIYAPFNVDMRSKYRICGNEPGIEPPEQLEMGLKALGAPADGLYLREDVELKANIALISFVKSETQKYCREMVNRIIKKAELLGSGVLGGLVDNGMLKTVNPADRSSGSNYNNLVERRTTVSYRSPLPSPTQLFYPPSAPSSPIPKSLSPAPYQVQRPASYQTANTVTGYPPPGQPLAGYPQTNFPPGNYPPPPPGYMYAPAPHAAELQGAEPAPTAPLEMAGDFYFQPQQQQAQQQQQQQQQQLGQAQPSLDSATSSLDRLRLSSDPTTQQQQWQGGAAPPALGASRPPSLSSSIATLSSSGGQRSPGLDSSFAAPPHTGKSAAFASGLSTHQETPEEHRGEALRKLSDPAPNVGSMPPPLRVMSTPPASTSPHQQQQQPKQYPPNSNNKYAPYGLWQQTQGANASGQRHTYGQ